MSSLQDVKNCPCVVIDDVLLKNFQSRYGLSTGISLSVFFETWKQRGEVPARLLVPERTFYFYRNLLLREGFLSAIEPQKVEMSRDWMRKKGIEGV